MSGSENSQGTSVGQHQSDNLHELHPTVERCLVVLTRLLEIFVEVLTSPAARAIGKRLGLLAESSFIPTSGHCDVQGLAALLNISKEGARAFVARNHTPAMRGSRTFYRVSDVPLDFTPAGHDDPEA